MIQRREEINTQIHRLKGAKRLLTDNYVAARRHATALWREIDEITEKIDDLEIEKGRLRNE